MNEKLKRIEFKHISNLSFEEIARVSGFLITRTRIYRESERARLWEEVVEQGKTNGFARHEAAGRCLKKSVNDVTPDQEFHTRVRWLDEEIQGGYYEIMGKMTPKSDKLSTANMNIGMLGIQPVFLEQHWHTDDLDDPERDYTEFQYIVGDPKTMANPPLADEIKSHLEFAAFGAAVSDKEIPSIESFGTITEGMLRDILPS